jgi:hypothetical protein
MATEQTSASCAVSTALAGFHPLFQIGYSSSMSSPNGNLQPPPLRRKLSHPLLYPLHWSLEGSDTLLVRTARAL